MQSLTASAEKVQSRSFQTRGTVKEGGHVPSFFCVLLFINYGGEFKAWLWGLRKMIK